MSAELVQLQSDIDAQTEAFLRKGGAITHLNWAGVPVDGTPVEPKPERSYGRLYPQPAPTVEAPQIKALPPVEVAPAPAADRESDLLQAEKDMADDLAPQRLRYTIQQLRDLRADARRWMRRLDEAFPR